MQRQKNLMKKVSIIVLYFEILRSKIMPRIMGRWLSLRLAHFSLSVVALFIDCHHTSPFSSVAVSERHSERGGNVFSSNLLVKICLFLWVIVYFCFRDIKYKCYKQFLWNCNETYLPGLQNHTFPLGRLVITGWCLFFNRWIKPSSGGPAASSNTLSGPMGQPLASHLGGSGSRPGETRTHLQWKRVQSRYSNSSLLRYLSVFR
jgi:hypothetical protein